MWTVLERASAAQERLLELTGVTRDVRALEIAALRLGDPALSPAPAPLLAEVRALSAELRGTPVMGAAERAPFAVLLSALARLDAALAGPAAGQRQAADEVAQAAQTLASALNRRTDAEMTWTQATEALGRQQLWRMTAFGDLGMERVQLKTDHMNLRSQRAIEKLGATREGVLRRHLRRPDGTWRDTVMYSLLREEWLQAQARLRATTS
ncbi:Acetyltransferase, putative [Deinococcus gobiensis I-0]|uniref:Acetyltransferase, putative n=2 Tax=Deinococcus TaxID=1298 RepID=H8GSI6_DEIGI|nr:Acetyltransferase, putative [Deinococcus gobiensis I-0]